MARQAIESAQRGAAYLDRLAAVADDAIDLQSERKRRGGDAVFVMSEDSAALLFRQKYRNFRYVPPWNRWLQWDGMRWREDSTARLYALIRELIREIARATKFERTTASAAFVAGVEKLLRYDQDGVILPEQLDADPWILNTQSGIVDLRTGEIRPHDPAAYCTKIARAPVDATNGAELWREFLFDVTQHDDQTIAYLQRVAGYCATGVTTEDVLVYLFGIGANGKSSFAEAIGYALGDYAKVFPAEVLMEAKGERHPTDLAQFIGIRFALTSEPGSAATWNDSRVKSLTGDAEISARFMRGDFFTFHRTHKTVVLGNHLPRLSAVSHAMRRRLQTVPFRAVFTPEPGPGMRERLKTEASGAVLAWIVQGARMWSQQGTSPPKLVRELTADYFADQDEFGQWLDERCERVASSVERSSVLHSDYRAWCEAQGNRPKSNQALSAYLVSAGIKKGSTMVGRVFYGLKLKGS